MADASPQLLHYISDVRLIGFIEKATTVMLAIVLTTYMSTGRHLRPAADLG